MVKGTPKYLSHPKMQALKEPLIMHMQVQESAGSKLFQGPPARIRDVQSVSRIVGKEGSLHVPLQHLTGA